MKIAETAAYLKKFPLKGKKNANVIASIDWNYRKICLIKPQNNDNEKLKGSAINNKFASICKTDIPRVSCCGTCAFNKLN